MNKKIHVSKNMSLRIHSKLLFGLLLPQYDCYGFLCIVRKSKYKYCLTKIKIPTIQSGLFNQHNLL